MNHVLGDISPPFGKLVHRFPAGVAMTPQEAAHGRTRAPDTPPAMNIDPAPGGKVPVDGVQDDGHFRLGGKAPVPDGEANMIRRDAMNRCQSVEDSIVGFQLERLGEVDKCVKPGFKEGVDAVAGGP